VIALRRNASVKYVNFVRESLWQMDETMISIRQQMEVEVWIHDEEDHLQYAKVYDR
jgi:hypothetical protein